MSDKATNTIINAKEIERFLSLGDFKEVEVNVFDTIKSTQQLALQSSLQKPQLFIANQQTEGRGRNDRKWVSAPNSQILMSLVWCYSRVPKELSAISLVLAVELVELLHRFNDVKLSLKWPNDVFLQDKKLAGLLIDAHSSKCCKLVAGLGLNVKLPIQLREEQNAADLSVLGAQVTREQLIAAISQSWFTALQKFERSGFGEWQQRYNKLSLYYGQEVLLKNTKSRDTMSGIYNGVSEDGCLILETDMGIKKIWDSEWSLRISG